MSDSVFARIEELLKRHGVAFDVLRHEPVYTSQEAAEVRGTPLASGAKALICKADGRFLMFVIPPIAGWPAGRSAGPAAGAGCDSPIARRWRG